MEKKEDELMDDQPDLITDFIQETESALDELETSIIDLKNYRYEVNFDFQAYIGFMQGLDIDLYISSIEAINRVVHTIKGVSLFLELNQISAYCHAVEEATTKIVKGMTYLDASAFDIIEKIPIRLNRFLESIKQTGTDADISIDQDLTDVKESTESCLNKMNGKVLHLKELKGKDFGRVRDQKKDLKVAIQLNEYDDILQDFQAFSQDIIDILARSGQNIETVQNIKRSLMEHLDRLVLSARSRIVLSRYPRLVSDLSDSLGKKITFNILSNDAFARPDVWDRCHNALVHIVRNAVDHGIEKPEIREQNGKESVGNMTLNIEEDFRNIYISIEDDGIGIDAETIATKALKKGVVSEQQVSRMTDLEKQRLIFHPGFSTRDSASDISGRGVGMDVVIREIEENLNGKVILNSRKNVGTSFILEIPKAETLSECIKFGDEERCYAIPVVPGIEFLECEARYVNNLFGRTAIFNKGNLTFPLVNLFVQLNHDEYVDQSTEYMPIIKIGKENDQFGIIVPKIMGTERIKIDRNRSFRNIIGDSEIVFGFGLTNPVIIVLDIDKIREMIDLS